MGKREDDRSRRHEAWCRYVEKLGWTKTDAFEKGLNAPDSAYRLGDYHTILHRTIMHYARKAMVRSDYDREYAMSGDYVDKTVDLIARQTRLALAAHKIDIETAKLERQVSADALKRHLAQKSRKFWDQPHASHFEPDKHLQPGQGSGADVRLPALQGADEDGDVLP